MKKLLIIPVVLLAITLGWNYLYQQIEPVPLVTLEDLGVSRPTYLPDPKLTPGLINTAVTQQNLSKNVCRCYGAKEKCNSYAKEVRPPTSWTAPREKQSIKDYGYKDTNPSHYEYDHFVPISLGGAPKNEKNLWAQPLFLKITRICEGKNTDDPKCNDGEFGAAGMVYDYGAKSKDRVEFFLYREMCSGRITLKEAQSK